MEVNPLIAFGAGLISIFSPCVLPLLPAIVASSTDRGRYRPVAIVLGLSISFTTMGIVASAFGAAFAAFSNYLFGAAILLIIAMGFWMLFDLHLPYNTPRLGIIDRVSSTLSVSLSLCSLLLIRLACRRLLLANRRRPFGSSASPA